MGVGLPPGPDATADGVSPACVEITRRIRARGPITFAEFMEVALYWPEGGYYTSQRTPWGAKGDYVTSLDFGEGLALALAKTFYEAWSCLGRPDEFVIVEAGAGRGLLTKGLLGAIERAFPDFYPACRATLVEKNPALHDSGSERLVWRQTLDGMPPFTGCVFSNELIDSMPVHRVIFQDGGLKEIYTGLDGDSFADVVGPPSTPALARYFERLGTGLLAGQKAEVNLNALDWAQSAGSLIERGLLVTIDYGFGAKDLYSPERLAGTLRTLKRHRAYDDPYLDVGSCDITAHVDFSSFAAAGKEAGLELTGFTTQGNFMLATGAVEAMIGGEAPSGPEAIRRVQDIKSLIMPGGMGDTFKVLVQHRGMQRPSLSGLCVRDLSRYL